MRACFSCVDDIFDKEKNQTDTRAEEQILKQKGFFFLLLFIYLYKVLRTKADIQKGQQRRKQQQQKMLKNK